MTRYWFQSSLRKRTVLALVVTSVAVLVGVTGWIRSHRPDTQSLIDQAYDFIQNGDLDSARQVLTEVQQYKPDDAEVVESLADICIHAGDEAAAIDWLQKVPVSAPQRAVDAAFRGAQLAMQWNRAGGARQCLDRCLQLNPDHAAARRLLVHLELILTRWEAMFAEIAELDKRGQATPADVALFCVGRNFYWEDDSHLEWLETCVSKSPDDCLTRTALAYYHSLQSRYNDAHELLHGPAAPRTGFENWRITLGMVEGCLNTGETEKAYERLSGLPPEADSSLRTWLAYAHVFTEKKEFEKAITAYKNASRLSPFDPEPVSAISRLLRRKNKLDAAAMWAHRAQLNSELWQILSHAKPLEPQGPSAETVMKMGRLLNDLDRHREAIICFKTLSDHVEFGVEATRLTEVAGKAIGQQHTLTVANVRDLDRSISVAGTRRGTTPIDAVSGQSSGAQLNTTVELRDIAAKVGLDFEFFQGDAEQDSLAETLGGGIGVIDFDMDDWPDVFFTQGASTTALPQAAYSNRLFRNIHGARAVDVTNTATVSHGAYGQGCAVADINEDGFPDLFVSNNGENVVYQNNGDGTFRDVTGEAGLQGTQWSTSASFADFDRDGDLDLYSANYVRIPEGGLKLCQMGNYYGPCRVMDFPAEQDIFWANQGDGTFRNRTDSVGVLAANGKGLGVISTDFDNDGWIDLFVGNDTTGNFLFQNLGTGSEGAVGTASEWRGFREMGVQVGVAFNRDGKGEACMGIACEDLNHDGLFDIFITNYELETNTFYANLGSLGFEDRTHRTGLAAASRPMLGWGVQFIDLDADRNRDLFITNGHLYDPPMYSQLFLNRAGEFIDVSARAGRFFESKEFGRSAAIIDWNRDLAADLIVSRLRSPVALLTNSSPAGNRLTVRLIGVESTRQVQSARVSVTAGGNATHFQASSDGGYFAANESDIKIGLGSHKHAEMLEVKWPSGRVQRWHQLRAGRKYVLIEGRPSSWVLEWDGDESSF